MYEFCSANLDAGGNLRMLNWLKAVTTHRRTDRNVLWVLAAGFALTILLLLGSGWLSVQAVESVEAQTELLLAEHRVSTQLIDEIQGEGASLNALFYAITVRPRQADRAELVERLGVIEQEVRDTLASARSERHRERWDAAKSAVEGFIPEVRAMVQAPADREPPASLYRAHETLITEISRLVAATYTTAVQEESSETSAHRDQLGRALILLGIALLLSVLCAVATIRVAARMFRRTEKQARELARLSKHQIVTQEQMLRRFSRELHDEFGQALTAIEANLTAVPAESPEARSRLEDCSLLVKDLMSNIRELSQLLRPSTLDDFGLKPSLQWLAESFTQRTGIAVVSRLDFGGRLGGEIETHLFRIAQEALTNIARHSSATRVELILETAGDTLRLKIADNGGGLKSTVAGRGLGLAGMRERMRVSGGHCEIQSTPQGVTVIAEVSLDEAAPRAKAHPSPVGG